MVTYDYVVYIGRFQPLHNGHVAVINEAIERADKRVIVLVGSATTPRSIKNPLSYGERYYIIGSEFPTSKVAIAPIQDFPYNDQQWVIEVQRKIAEIVARDGWSDKPRSVALIGLDKDYSTRYLKWFPQWDFIHVEPTDMHGVDATQIREIIYTKKNIAFLEGVVPASTMHAIRSKDWSDLFDEYEFINKYKKAWASAPYAPTFVTVDAVVIQDGHVLMVERGASPGKGLMALPGGFIEPNERIADAVIRELREETRLKVPEPVLRGSVVGTGVFDAPDRSLRGRTITHATLFKLASTGSLPQVKGSDDAAKAFWVPLSELQEDQIFEDHFAIIMNMVGKL